MGETLQQPFEPPRPASVPAGPPPSRALAGAVRAWDDALRTLDRGLRVTRGATILALFSPVFLFFSALLFAVLIRSEPVIWGILYGFYGLLALSWVAGWIVWGAGLWRVRGVVGSARARREFGGVLLVLLLVPLSGLCLLIQTTRAGGLMTAATTLVLVVLTVILTRGALERLSSDEGIPPLPVPGGAMWWPTITIVGGLLMALFFISAAGWDAVIVFIPFVILALVIVYIRQINRCREMLWRLRGIGRWRRR